MKDCKIKQQMSARKAERKAEISGKDYLVPKPGQNILDAWLERQAEMKKEEQGRG